MATDFLKKRGEIVRIRSSAILHPSAEWIQGAELVVALYPFSPGNFVLFKKVRRHTEFPEKTSKWNEEPSLPSYTMPHALDMTSKGK